MRRLNLTEKFLLSSIHFSRHMSEIPAKTFLTQCLGSWSFNKKKTLPPLSPKISPRNRSSSSSCSILREKPSTVMVFIVLLPAALAYLRVLATAPLLAAEIHLSASWFHFGHWLSIRFFEQTSYLGIRPIHPPTMSAATQHHGIAPPGLQRELLHLFHNDQVPF